MIVDSSALVAIVRGEAERLECLDALERAEHVRISAANFVEAAIVIDRAADPTESTRFDQLLRTLSLQLVPVTELHARMARAAYHDYGKGSGHPAQLNFGDCFSYALAIESAEPLLYKGTDFGHTAVRSAI